MNFESRHIELFSEDSEERETEEEQLFMQHTTPIKFDVKSSTASSALSYEINHSNENTPNKDDHIY